MKEVVIIGGGFAGINMINHLANKEGFHITLVDKNNYNFFPPLLYQVATGFLEVTNISYPFRKLFQKKRNVNFRMGTLEKVLPEQNKVILSTGELEYDYLIMATGTETNYFGIENIARHSLPMKTVNDALFLRNYMLQRMEDATICTDITEKRRLATIVIAGGGPTGVEVAGMLAEMRRNIFAKDYPELAGIGGGIHLVDGAPTLLTPMSAKSQQYTFDSLVKLGVDVRLNLQVKDYINGQVVFSDGSIIESKILIWAAGVTATVFEGFEREQYGRGRRLLTDEYNKVIGTENIYALGDTCLLSGDPEFPNGHPQVAQVAIQQGARLAKNLMAMQKSAALVPFRYKDRGSMAIIGRNKAAADFPKPKLSVTGFIAWFMWLFVHLMSLINFRNKFTTMYNWAIAFFTKDHSLRMIIRPLKRAPEKGD